MLLEMRFRNFFSIKDEVCIDFKAGTINTAGAKELSDNIFSFNDETLLKVQGLFGPNASGINYLLYPTAFSVEPMSSLPGTEFWNLSLADLGSLYKEEEEKPNTGKIKIDFENDTQRTVLTDDNGTQTLINSYSVASRVLVSDLIDMEKMENHFLIISASLGSQILKTYSLTKSNGEKGPELNVKDIAEFLFNVLIGKIQVREIDGKVSFDELKKNFE